MKNLFRFLFHLFIFFTLTNSLFAQEVRVIDNKGTLKYIWNGIQPWNRAALYVNGQYVEKDKKIYRANAPIPSGTNFSVGESGPTWELVSGSLSNTHYFSSPITLESQFSTDKLQIENSGSITIDANSLVDGFSAMIINHSDSDSSIQFSNFNAVFDLNFSKKNITANGSFNIVKLESVFITVNVKQNSDIVLNIHRSSGLKSVTNELFFDGIDDADPINDDFYYISMLINGDWKVVRYDKTDVNVEQEATIGNNNLQNTQPITLAVCTGLNY